MVYIKGYMKKIIEILKEKNPDRVAPFQKNVQGFVKGILGKFDDYQFFMGESVSANLPSGLSSCCWLYCASAASPSPLY